MHPNIYVIMIIFIVESEIVLRCVRVIYLRMSIKIKINFDSTKTWQENWKTMEHESDCDTNFNWCTRYNDQSTSTGTGGLGNKRMSGDHPNNSIVEIGQNTKKNPGDLTSLTVTLTLKPSANAGVKNSQKSKIIITKKLHTGLPEHSKESETWRETLDLF